MLAAHLNTLVLEFFNLVHLNRNVMLSLEHAELRNLFRSQSANQRPLTQNGLRLDGDVSFTF